MNKAIFILFALHFNGIILFAQESEENYVPETASLVLQKLAK